MRTSEQDDRLIRRIGRALSAVFWSIVWWN